MDADGMHAAAFDDNTPVLRPTQVLFDKVAELLQTQEACAGLHASIDVSAQSAQALNASADTFIAHIGDGPTKFLLSVAPRHFDIESE